jgi:hypothetical protein
MIFSLKEKREGSHRLERDSEDLKEPLKLGRGL